MLVHSMSEMLDRALGPSVLIETRFPLNLPWIKTDPNQLEMALLNLMVNARDAMPQGGPIVVAARSETIGQGQHLAAGSYVCLAVSDSGEGMGEDTLARATDPVFTTEESRERNRSWVAYGSRPSPRVRWRTGLERPKGTGNDRGLWFPVAEKSPATTTVGCRTCSTDRCHLPKPDRPRG
jgi:signal transduction histidine kinase